MPAVPSPPRTKAAQREATVGRLVAHARQAFATQGYADASLTAIVAAAGVTKGALYHHFPGGKPDLFRAVLREVHQEVADRVAMAAPDASPWTQLLAGCKTFLIASTDPDIQQIMLVDAPAVLGWGVWREFDATTSMQHRRTSCGDSSTRV
jgi:AcrR family transcriptional regulator